MNKVCSKCKEEKNVINFDVNNLGGKLNRHSICKECKSRYIKQYRKTHDKEFKRRNQEYRIKLKLEVLTHYCNGKPYCQCIGCNITDIEFLTIDHCNGDGAKHRRGMTVNFYNWLKTTGYPKEYRVLCWNCNCVRRFNNQCPHQRTR